MLFLTVFTALYTVFCVFIFNYIINKRKIEFKINLFVPCVISGLLIRLVLAYINMGHSTDMNCFSAWADMLYHDGIGVFYSSDKFTDYPPGYMYILNVLGYIINLFSPTKGVENVILRFPAILCDIVTGVFVYLISKKKFEKPISASLAAFYIFNPAVILNSSIWGQVDAVYLVLIIGSLYFLTVKKIILAFSSFALAVLFKPQALILSPVFIFFSYEYLFGKEKIKARYVKLFSAVVLALLALILPMLPFCIYDVISQYMSTLSSYPYATVNAFNLWGALGLNWFELNWVISLLGYLFIVLICIFSGVIYFKENGNSRYFKTAAFLYFATYMLSCKMHERYAFCAIGLAFFAFILSEKRKDFLLFLFLTISQAINTGWVLFVYENSPGDYYRSVFIIIASILNIVLLIFMGVSYLSKKDFLLLSPPEIQKIEKTQKPLKLTRKDVFAIFIITAFYSVVALTLLGSNKAPETEVYLTQNSHIDISFENPESISKIALFNGSLPIEEENSVIFNLYDDEYKLIKTVTFSDNEVFSWHFNVVEDLFVKHITVTADDVRLKEIVFVDDLGNTVVPEYVCNNALFDEQELMPDSPDWYNGTYFDEIYHARTAYEFIHGLDVYEWTHPPLGKLFIAIGIKLFGMNPFGWRIAGTVFGILMLPFIYLFAKKITSKTSIASVVCIIFAFDFMHFTQTRIATIDVYITFFVILMYYFMYSYYQMSFYDTGLKKTLMPLFASGICFGLGVACKWTGIYAGAGLCVIFFMTILKRFREYLFAKDNPCNEQCEHIKRVFLKNTISTLLWCIVFFIAIPVIIYLVSYIPYVNCEGGGIGAVIKNQVDMYVYHSSTVLSSTHPYSSKWYEWIIMKRPIWYYSGQVNESLCQGISAFGNPLVWWGGIVAMLFVIARAIFKKDKKAIFIVTGYFAQLIPWMFVDRVVFIYHYFPSTVFLVFAIGYSFDILCKKNEKFIKSAYLYAALTVIMFFAFYPVLSGMAINPEYVYKYLKWFESWVLI